MASEITQSVVPISLGDLGKTFDDVGPSARDSLEGVDGARPNPGVGVRLREVERAGHPQVLTGATFVLFAPVARECVEHAADHAGVVVIEGRNEVGQRFVIDQVVEEIDHLAADDWLGVVQTATEGW